MEYFRSNYKTLIFKTLILLLLSIFFAMTLVGQQNNADETPSTNQELKRNFMGIELGQDLEQFRAQVTSRDGDAYYHFLYELYTSEIEEGGNQGTLIEVKGNGYVEKGVFQFASFDGEPQLVTMTIFLSPEWNSYDQIFVKLTNDYGNPSKLNPQRSIWENEQTIITLEKNLRYKIIDKEYLRNLKEQDQEEFDLYQNSYEEFLKKF